MRDGSDRGWPAPCKRRRGDRHTVMIPAAIRCPDGQTFACVLRDMSLSGAKLSVSRRHRLPPAFVLAVTGRDYPVRRVWQRTDFAGIVLDVAAPDSPDGETA